MPKVSYKIITPLGEFGSARKAAVAHNCDPGTILKRCETDPENYQRTAKQPGAVRPRAKKTQWVTKKITWPLTWSEYRYNTYEVKEEIYQIWCAENSQDPDTELTAEAFFDAMTTQDVTAEDQDQEVVE
jgi:hypothetical protein